MKLPALMTIFAAFAVVVGFGAQPSSGAAKACPNFTIKAQAADGDMMFFVEPAKDGLTYNWSLSAGTINSGQGTSTIVVATTGIPTGENVTATVEIGGLKASCAKEATLSASAKVP